MLEQFTAKVQQPLFGEMGRPPRERMVRGKKAVAYSRGLLDHGPPLARKNQFQPYKKIGKHGKTWFGLPL